MKTISKITLKLEGREIELTADEARQLQAELNLLFKLAKPEVVTKEIHHHHAPAPIYIDRYVPHWPQRWDVWCSTSGGTKAEASGMLMMDLTK